MNEPCDGKQSMESVMVEATALLALGVAPTLPSSFEARGHDRVMLDRDVERRETACGTGPAESSIPAYGWGGTEKDVKRSRMNCCCCF